MIAAIRMRPEVLLVIFAYTFLPNLELKFNGIVPSGKWIHASIAFLLAVRYSARLLCLRNF